MSIIVKESPIATLVNDEVPSDLDTKTNKSGKTASDTRRHKRWNMLFHLWEFSSLKRVRACRRWSHNTFGEVNVRMSEREDGSMGSGYEGLAKCGSAWACPLCAASIEAKRREEIQQIVEGATCDGYAAAFLTMTLRHMAGQSLSKLLDASAKMYRSVMDSRAVRSRLDDLERQGYVRVLEITHGLNGWHPHYHLILLFDWNAVALKRGLEPSEAPWKDEQFNEALQDLADAMHATWAKRARKEGLGEPLREFFDIRPIDSADISQYLTKQTVLVINEKEIAGASYETAGRTLKEGRKDSRTPWDIFQDFTETGDLEYLDLWNEYEQAPKGKRSVVFSQGLKKRYVGVDKSDQEIVDEEVGTVEDRVFTIIDWSTVARVPGLPSQILSTLEREGIASAMAECVWNGVPVRLPQKGSSSPPQEPQGT